MLSLPANFKPDQDFLDLFRLLNDSYNNIFITGKAGTGKSTLIEYFKQHTEKKLVILASTGIAAQNIGGQTIHSFFGYPPRIIRPNDPEISFMDDSDPKKKIINQMDTLLIDEVSMVRPDLLDAIDGSLQLNLGSNLPFGGVQVILVGDCYQLAPVESAEDPTYDNYLPPKRNYKSNFFFSAEAFKRGNFIIRNLTKIHRQKEGSFTDVLNSIRQGKADEDELEILNARVNKDVDAFEYDLQPPILLCTTNRIADRENARRLQALTTDSHYFQTQITGTFPAGMRRTDDVLELKIGARVMMLTNDPERRWSNGSIGAVKEIEIENEFDDTPDRILVEFDNGKSEWVTRFLWENQVFNLGNDGSIGRTSKGTCRQFPLRHAWAVTIHKSQGLTFDKVRIDLGSGVFASGQLYVALSRCRTLEGITLLRPINKYDLVIDGVVNSFYGWVEEQFDKEPKELIMVPRRPEKPALPNKKADRELKKRSSEKKTEASRLKNLSSGKLANEGLRWKQEELNTLREKFTQGLSLGEIAATLERKDTAVGSKLKSIGLLEAFSIPKSYIITRLVPDFEPTKEEALAQKEFAFKEWTTEEEQALLKSFEYGVSPEELIEQHERSALSLLIRLENLGAFEGKGKVVFDQLQLEYRVNQNEEA